MSDKHNLKYEIIHTLEDIPINCYSKEQYLLDLYKSHRFKCNHNEFKTNEALNKNVITLQDMIDADVNHTRTFKFKGVKIPYNQNQRMSLDLLNINTPNTNAYGIFEDWV